MSSQNGQGLRREYCQPLGRHVVLYKDTVVGVKKGKLVFTPVDNCNYAIADLHEIDKDLVRTFRTRLEACRFRDRMVRPHLERRKTEASHQKVNTF